MSNKPIFVATHPRACSTAFERAFMTRRELKCVHEPFGDAFYYGPERLSSRYENDGQTRTDSGFKDSTFRTILDRIEEESAEGKRLFIKDMAHYLIPPDGKAASIAPSLARIKRGVGTPDPSSDGTESAQKAPYPYNTEPEPGNPTVIPEQVLRKFHFTFLIRHPRSSVPSYYRCTIPPLDEVTGFYNFSPSEAGYDELRRVFDYLRSVGQIGPHISGQDDVSKATNGDTPEAKGVVNGCGDKVDICVVDADDLLDNPGGMIEAYCKSVGIKYDPQMLDWSTEEDRQQAREAFEKWRGFHDDAMESSSLRPRLHKKEAKSIHDEDREWVQKFGEKGAKVIREVVDANIEAYEYLKRFSLKI